jgi:DNA repair protein RadC
MTLCRHLDDLAAAEIAANQLVRRYDSIHRLAELSIDDLKAATGFDAFECERILACLELGRRVGQSNRGSIERIDGPEDVAKLLSYLKGEKREHFVSIMLDAQNQVLRIGSVHIGTLTQSVVGAREVFREAIREGACSIIVAHNHPSGNSHPSPEDIAMTKELVQVGKLLDIPVLDHVIVGECEFTSLNRGGWL